MLASTKIRNKNAKGKKLWRTCEWFFNAHHTGTSGVRVAQLLAIYFAWLSNNFSIEAQDFTRWTWWTGEDNSRHPWHWCISHLNCQTPQPPSTIGWCEHVAAPRSSPLLQVAHVDGARCASCFARSPPLVFFITCQGWI